MEASALPATAGLGRKRVSLGAPLLRLRSDEQLVSLFRSGSEEAFRAIHDRYRQRMLAYARQMLSGACPDAEDAVQEIFVRAYRGLRANDRELALRAWLYRIAHNRCVDELRRRQAIATDAVDNLEAHPASDPVARMEQRDALKRLIADVRLLPEQQRSALLLRELAGMSYADVAGALSVSVPAVKSLLVRARVGLAQASEARDTACALIREDLIVAHDRGVRLSGLSRRHLRECSECRRFRSEVRGVSRQLAGFVPALGPLGAIAKLLGVGSAGGGGIALGTGAVAGGGGAAAGVTGTAAGVAGTAAGVAGTAAGVAGTAAGVAGTGVVASAGAIATASHVVTILAAAVVTAGGAIELQHVAAPVPSHTRMHRVASRHPGLAPGADVSREAQAATADPEATAPGSVSGSTGGARDTGLSRLAAAHRRSSPSSPALALTEITDPDHLALTLTLAALDGGTTAPAAGANNSATGASPTSAGTTSSGASQLQSATGAGTQPAGTGATGTAGAAGAAGQTTGIGATSSGTTAGTPSYGTQSGTEVGQPSGSGADTQPVGSSTGSPATGTYSGSSAAGGSPSGAAGTSDRPSGTQAGAQPGGSGAGAQVPSSDAQPSAAPATSASAGTTGATTTTGKSGTSGAGAGDTTGASDATGTSGTGSTTATGRIRTGSRHLVGAGSGALVLALGHRAHSGTLRRSLRHRVRSGGASAASTATRKHK